MQTTTGGSNVLRFPAQTGGASRRIDPARRFGRPRYSSLYRLGARLLNRASSISITSTVTQLVVAVRSRYVGRQLRRSSSAILSALDELVVLNTRAYPGNLDVLVREIETRKQRWPIATADVQDCGRQGS